MKNPFATEEFVVLSVVGGTALLVLAAIVGWVLNIAKLVPMEGATGTLILRAVGIVLAPLGAVLGYCG